MSRANENENTQIMRGFRKFKRGGPEGCPSIFGFYNI